jgi:hypothetical protein
MSVNCLCQLSPASAGRKPLLVAVVVRILLPLLLLDTAINSAGRKPLLVVVMRLQSGVLIVLHGLVASNIKNIVLNHRFIQCYFFTIPYTVYLFQDSGLLFYEWLGYFHNNRLIIIDKNIHN